MNNLWSMENMDRSVQEELAKYHAKNQMDINKAIAKEQYLNDLRIDLAQRKMQLQECWREARKASYVEVHVGKEGKLEMETKNAVVRLPKREVSHFRVSKFFALQSSEGEAGIYGLEIVIANRRERIFLSGKDMGKMDYFHKKIVAVGGQIYASTKKERGRLLESLWGELCCFCTTIEIVPTKYGWFRNGEGEYMFAEEGAILWEEIKELAK